MNPEDNQALSTNWELYVVPIEGGESKMITGNLAADASPVYSPDGKYLAWRAQSKPGYESDRWRLMVYDRATSKAVSLTDSLDRSVQSITWAPDSRRIFFTIEDRGRTTLHVMPVAGGGSRELISARAHVDDVQFAPDGRTMVYSEHSGSKPVEFYRVSSSGGSAIALTRMNDALLSAHALQAMEDFTVENPNDKVKVQSFLVKPPGFDSKQKYPVLFLIHGGPQGAWGESWSYRWNPQIFAAAGFVVVMPNPRGSTGYGQQFTDDINQDWAGRVYDDLMASVDYVAGQPWADSKRFAAAGGSYGGYMVNWLLGHSNRFQAYVSHAGVYDLKSMAGETEELWFTRWEFGGMPWDNPDVYQKWSPSNSVTQFRTPTLVIHGELDYRVPVGQGLQLFTGLQMQKVHSKLLLFPDEGHWILKPQNSMLWYNSVIDWVKEWTAKKE
jgi:dipeptidyl aminopeptidase/acylaminoacyl peptidase